MKRTKTKKPRVSKQKSATVNAVPSYSTNDIASLLEKHLKSEGINAIRRHRPGSNLVIHPAYPSWMKAARKMLGSKALDYGGGLTDDVDIKVEKHSEYAPFVKANQATYFYVIIERKLATKILYDKKIDTRIEKKLKRVADKLKPLVARRRQAARELTGWIIRTIKSFEVLKENGINIYKDLEYSRSDTSIEVNVNISEKGARREFSLDFKATASLDSDESSAAVIELEHSPIEPVKSILELVPRLPQVLENVSLAEETGSAFTWEWSEEDQDGEELVSLNLTCKGYHAEDERWHCRFEFPFSRQAFLEKALMMIVTYSL